MTVESILAVAAGAFLGAILRYSLSKKLNRTGAVPFGTLAVNLFGCLLIGFVMGKGLSEVLTFFLAAGFAGSLTTFSTWMKEVLGMICSRSYARAAIYTAGSVIAGLLCAAAGYAAGALFVS